MRRTSAAALCAVLLFSVTAVAAVYLNAPTASRAEVTAAAPKIGDKIADFSLPDAMTGTARSLKELSAGKKAVALIFISTQCPVSNAYNGRMAQIASDFGSKGIQVVGINSNRSEMPADITAHAKANNLTFPILKDTGNKIADRLDAQVTPEVYLVKPNGELIFHGPIDDRQQVSDVQHTYLHDALNAVTGGKSIAVTGARAFGCSIKRAPSAS